MKVSFRSLLTQVSTAVGLSMTGAYHALAISVPSEVPINATAPGTGEDQLISALVDIVQIVLNLIGIIAVIVIIVAGLRLIIGGQDEGQREKARNMIVYAIIGLIIIIFAKVIVDFVVSAFVESGAAT